MKKPIVMVGVLPPPVHGQSLATKALFEADIEGVEQVVVEIGSSRKLAEVGKPSLMKMFGLLGVIYRVLKAQSNSGSDVMYYTAGSAALVPFIRDIVLLGCLRPFFRKTLIHYHSGGLPEYLNKSCWRFIVGSWIYGRGAWSLSLSKHTAVPGIHFGAAREIEIPNGVDVPDVAPQNLRKEEGVVNILFVGNLFEDKGVFDLIDAVGRAAEKTDQKLRLSLVGKFPDDETERKCKTALKSLCGKVLFNAPSARYGDEKWQEFAEADVFAFPSFYRSENLPLVVIEAMGMSLPIVSTNWRGLPSLVQDGVNGYLSEPRAIEALSDNIVKLASSAALRQQMAEKSREIYLRKFTFRRHLYAISSCLKEANY